MEKAPRAGFPLIVIENYEGSPSRWLIAEYVESHRVATSKGLRVVVAGVSNPLLASTLEHHGVPHLKEQGSILCPTSCTIVTDLRAAKPLRSHEAVNSCCIVVGGILGDHPPRGRGQWLRLTYPDAAYRNLGDKQFSIDGAVKVVLEILKGKELEDVKVLYPVTIKVNSLPSKPEIILPYAYPLKGGKPWISSGLRDLLERGLMWESI